MDIKTITILTTIITIIVLVLIVYIYANITTTHGYAISKNEANLAIFLNIILIVLLLISLFMPFFISKYTYYYLITVGLIIGISIINLVLLAKLGNSQMDTLHIQLVYYLLYII
jgi:hypothetical protein